MSQKKADHQPSALLMLSSEEMSCSLLGGLSDSNIPTLLAMPQELPSTSAESASQLFLTEDGDVDNFLGQTSSPTTSQQPAPQQKISSTISSFIPNPFSSPLLGTSRPSPLSGGVDRPQASAVAQPPSNVLANAPLQFKEDPGNPYQYRKVGKFQHVPPPSYYSPPLPPQQVPCGPPSAPLQSQQTQGMPVQPPSYIQPSYSLPPQERSHPHGHGVHSNVVAFYRPIESHWFYAKKAEGKVVWMPLSRVDSGRIEEAFADGGKTDRLVPVEGGRYDVDVSGRRKRPAYWSRKEGEDEEVRRCSWFYRPEGSTDFVPYDEKFAAGLEESYKHAVQNSDFHKRLAFPSGETIIIHSPTAIVHYPPSSQPDAWGNAMGDLRPQVVRRGVAEFENIPKDESNKVDHLVLVVLGFNHEPRKVIQCVEEFRRISDQMLEGHFSRPLREGQIGRVEFLPVVWSDTDLLDDVAGVDGMLKTLTLTGISKLRRFTNEMILELMFYASPSHSQRAVTLLTEAMNRVYETFKGRHCDFTGGVSIIGHGVGSVIVYDILANQGMDCTDPNKIERPACPEQPGVESPPNQVHPAGLRRAMNDSSSSLASSAESDRASVGPNSSLEEVLEKLGLREYEGKFKEERIDASSLVLLEDSDIKEIGLPLGPRKKLQDFIKKAQTQSSSVGENQKVQLDPPKLPRPVVQQCQARPIEDGGESDARTQAFSNATFTFVVKSSQEGEGSHGGVNVLVKNYATLAFEPANLFALGSPVALVLALRGQEQLGEEFRLPTCPGYYNIFHPSDPLAYRMEPMVLPSVPQKALLVPHHKGRKRLHLELKENLARIGFDIKQRIVESFRSTWRTINNFASGYRGVTPALEEPKVNEEEVDREVNSVLTEMQKEAEDAGSVVASSVADESDFPVGSLNQGRRVDFVLQERPLEMFNDYIFALASSSSYWQSEDTALMLLKEIYLTMGVVAQKPGVPDYPRPGIPIGPPPKSGFVQSSAISKSQGPALRSSPYVPYSASAMQPPPYQQPYWSGSNAGSYPLVNPVGPPPTGIPTSSPFGSLPANLVGSPPTNMAGIRTSDPVGPPPAGQMHHLAANQKLPPPLMSQMYQSPPLTNQAFSPQLPNPLLASNQSNNYPPSSLPPPYSVNGQRAGIPAGIPPPSMTGNRPPAFPPKNDFARFN